MNRRRVTLVTIVVVLAWVSILTMEAGAQAIMTDRPCYTAGDPVTVEGLQWGTGEVVTLTITADPPAEAPTVIDAFADESGRFSTGEFTVPATTGPAIFTLDCLGQSSGLSAQTRFMGLPTPEPAPAVATDQGNYTPGDVVRISGTGWLAGEEISLTLIEDPETHPPTQIDVIADGSGAFRDSSFVVQEHDLFAQFTLEAVGLTSGAAVPISFVDAPIEPPPLYVSQWGSYGTDDGKFTYPNAVAVDGSGNVYVTDGSNNRVQKFTSTGTFITAWGSRGTGNSQFRTPIGIAVDASDYVYVVDWGNNRIQKFTSSGTFVTKWGSYGTANGYLNGPSGIAVGRYGMLYVADTYNCRIQMFSSNGSYSGKWGSNGSGNGQFIFPVAVEADPARDVVHVADYYQPSIQTFGTYGNFIRKWGPSGSGEGQLSRPYGVTTDPAGNVFAAEDGNDRIQKFTGAAVFTTVWGSFGTGNGQFNNPHDVACVAGGRVYVVDNGNHRIQVFAPPPVGAVRGYVTATCPVPGTGMGGASVRAYKDGPGVTLVKATTTDGTGFYRLADLVPGTYWIRVLPMNGLEAEPWENDLPVTVSAGVESIQDFELMDLEAPHPTEYPLPEVRGECSVTITEAPTAIDNCAGLVTGTTTNPLTYTTQGTFTVVWWVRDGSGNIVVLNQRVIVQDETAPSIQAPPPVEAVATSGLPGSTALVADETLGTGEATDNCPGHIAITRSGVPEGNLFPLGTTTITWTATDAAGNSATATQDVLVTPPPTGTVAGLVTALCPDPGTGIAGTTVQAYLDGPGLTFVQEATTDESGHYLLADLLAGAYWIRVLPPNSLTAEPNDIPVGVVGGGESVLDFQLLDQSGPQPTLSSLPDVRGECSAAIAETPTAVDNCAGLVMGTTTDPVEYTAQGTFTVRWSYQDGSGNVVVQNQQVIVHDVTPPVIQAPPPVPALAGLGETGCAALVSDEALGAATGTDNCAGEVAITHAGVPAGNLFPLGTTIVTWTATDAAGNAASATQEVVVTPAPGVVAGHVLGEAPLFGVRVDVFDADGNHIGTAVTDEAGAYAIDGLPAQQSLTTTLVTPLGYVAPVEDVTVQIACGETLAVDFALTTVPIVANPRSSGFWKHQVGVATGGPGHAQVDGEMLCTFLDMIVSHFNENEVNPVVVYEPPESDLCPDKLEAAKALLNLKGNVGMTARARQQLMSTMLNVAAGYIALQEVVSQDGATLSQAITFCDSLIDASEDGHELAKTVADRINNNLMVGAGVIPLTTDNISYRERVAPEAFALARNQPNPFTGGTVIRYALPKPSSVRLVVYDMCGRVVRVLAHGALTAGWFDAPWDGRDASGARVPAGVYLYRLEARAEGEGSSRTLDPMKMTVIR